MMKRNNVKQDLVSSVDETKPDLQAAQETRIDGVDSKSSASMNNVSHSDASNDGNTGGVGEKKTNDTTGVVVGVVFLVLALLCGGVASWYFFGQTIKNTCLAKPTNPFDHKDSVHVTNNALVELAEVPPNAPPHQYSTDCFH